MKSRSAKPQDWRPAYDAYMAQKAADIHREGERVSVREAENTGLLGWIQQTSIYKNVIDPYIVQPINAHVYQPYIQPIVVRAREAWNEYVYKPYIQPAMEFAQNYLVQPIQAAWNEYVYDPYIKPALDRANALWGDVQTAFREHPVAAWVTAGTIAAGTIAGGYAVYCYGLSGAGHFSSAIPHLAGAGVLPLTGWLTTSGKRRKYGILVGMLFFGMLLSACGGGATANTPTPSSTCTNTPSPTETQTMTPPPPTVMATPDVIRQLMSNQPAEQMLMMNGWIVEYHLADPAVAQQYNYDQWLRDHGYDPTAYDPVTKAMIFWQNYYNEHILLQAQIYGLDPPVLKGQMLVESNGALDPGDYCTINGQEQYCRNDGAFGLMQITGVAMGDVLEQAPENLLEQVFNLYNYIGGPCPNGVGCDHASEPLLPFYDEQGHPLYGSYSQYYSSLKNHPSYSDFNTLSLRLVDGRCLHSDAEKMGCKENTIQPDEGITAVQLAAAIDQYNRGKLIQVYIGQENWQRLPQTEQDKIMLAAYNGGLDGVGDATAAVIARNGQLTSWDDVQTELENGRSTYTDNWCQAVVYPGNALCYASGGSGCTIQLAQTDINDADNDEDRKECAP